MRIVCISDVHMAHDRLALPEGDVLVIAGDSTHDGNENEIKDLNRWLGTLSFKHKLLIAGNHDFGFEKKPEEARSWITNATYLQDEEVTIDGLRFYGSPWQPWFYDWAFNLKRGSEIAKKWDQIPSGIDVLITHGPPWGILDQIPNGDHVGCEDLRDRVFFLKPQLHVFGHIHGGYGERAQDGTIFVNASIRGERYNLPLREAIVVDL